MIIDEVATSVAGWPILAKQAGVSEASMRMVQEALARVMADFGAD